MAPRALRANFDAVNIVLDEPGELAPGIQLLVTILPTTLNSPEGVLSAQRSASAFAEGEFEHTQWRASKLDQRWRARRRTCHR